MYTHIGGIGEDPGELIIRSLLWGFWGRAGGKGERRQYTMADDDYNDMDMGYCLFIFYYTHTYK